MKIMNVNNTNQKPIGFKSVTPIIAEKGGIKIVKEMLINTIGKKGYCLDDATHLYKKKVVDGQLSRAAANGKEIGFLVTGKEYEKYSFMHQGWTSETAPSRHIDRDTIEIEQPNEKVITKLIKEITTELDKLI